MLRSAATTRPRDAASAAGRLTSPCASRRRRVRAVAVREAARACENRCFRSISETPTGRRVCGGASHARLGALRAQRPSSRARSAEKRSRAFLRRLARGRRSTSTVYGRPKYAKTLRPGARASEPGSRRPKKHLCTGVERPEVLGANRRAHLGGAVSPRHHGARVGGVRAVCGFCVRKTIVLVIRVMSALARNSPRKQQCSFATALVHTSALSLSLSLSFN